MYCVIEKTLSQDKNTKLNVKAWAKNMRKRFPCTQQLMEYCSSAAAHIYFSRADRADVQLMINRVIF